MSITLVPVEQALAAWAVDRIIMRGSPTPAVILTRANTALEVAATITDLQNGNAAQAQQDFNTVIADPTMDPVIAFELQALEAAAIQQLAVANQIGNLVPIWGATAQAIATNLVAGITTAANILIKANSGTTADKPKA